jgi:hypothetical protein
MISPGLTSYAGFTTRPLTVTRPLTRFVCDVRRIIMRETLRYLSSLILPKHQLVRLFAQLGSEVRMGNGDELLTRSLTVRAFMGATPYSVTM